MERLSVDVQLEDVGGPDLWAQEPLLLGTDNGTIRDCIVRRWVSQRYCMIDSQHANECD
jgi:hypothetical protein